ncbi:MAG: dihydrofolate reductase family protein [Pseudomonadota bacterium]
MTFDPWPFEGKKLVVMSSRPVAIPAHLAATVSATSETPAALVARLTAMGCSHLYIDGGKTIQGFLAANLVDDITVTTIPVLIGAGRPLFWRVAEGQETQAAFLDVLPVWICSKHLWC